MDCTAKWKEKEIGLKTICSRQISYICDTEELFIRILDRLLGEMIHLFQRNISIRILC
jgi:hypothetical protein